MTSNQNDNDIAKALPRVVLLRHAQSLWNLENRFTGWADVGLTEAGRLEARRAAELLRAQGYRFDKAYTSVLTRAIETLEIVLRELRQTDIPVERHWRLNERHYGSLEGTDKAAFASRHGADLLRRYRRGYRDQPPPLSEDDSRHPRWREIYRDVDSTLLPATESLADTKARLLPYWEEKILPDVKRGKRLLIVSHGNTLRALIMHLEEMSETEIEHFEIPTGRPLSLEFTPDMKLQRRYYLDEPGARNEVA